MSLISSRRERRCGRRRRDDDHPGSPVAGPADLYVRPSTRCRCRPPTPTVCYPGPVRSTEDTQRPVVFFDRLIPEDVRGCSTVGCPSAPTTAASRPLSPSCRDPGAGTDRRWTPRRPAGDLPDRGGHDNIDVVAATARGVAVCHAADAPHRSSRGAHHRPPARHHEAAAGLGAPQVACDASRLPFWPSRGRAQGRTMALLGLGRIGAGWPTSVGPSECARSPTIRS